jgi:hypothetical protein
MGLETECVRTVKETIKGLGGLDIIVSNAVGVFLNMIHSSSVDPVSPDD